MINKDHSIESWQRRHGPIKMRLAWKLTDLAEWLISINFYRAADRAMDLAMYLAGPPTNPKHYDWYNSQK